MNSVKMGQEVGLVWQSINCDLERLITKGIEAADERKRRRDLEEAAKGFYGL